MFASPHRFRTTARQDSGTGRKDGVHPKRTGAAQIATAVVLPPNPSIAMQLSATGRQLGQRAKRRIVVLATQGDALQQLQTFLIIVILATWLTGVSTRRPIAVTTTALVVHQRPPRHLMIAKLDIPIGKLDGLLARRLGAASGSTWDVLQRSPTSAPLLLIGWMRGL